MFASLPLRSLAQSTQPDVGIRFQPPNAVLFTDATIVVNAERTLEEADLLVRDGKIVEVGVDLRGASRAEVIECKNKRYTRG